MANKNYALIELPDVPCSDNTQCSVTVSHKSPVKVNVRTPVKVTFTATDPAGNSRSCWINFDARGINFFIYIHTKDYDTHYIYILLYFLITIQLYNTTGRGPQGSKDSDYPVAIYIKTCK